MYGNSRFRRGSNREDSQAKRSFDKCLQQLQKLQLESPDIPESEKIKMFKMISNFTRILWENIGSNENDFESKGNASRQPMPSYYPPPPPQPQIIPMPIPMPQYSQPPPPAPQQNFQPNPYAQQQFQPNYPPAPYRRPQRYDSDDDSSDDMSYYSSSYGSSSQSQIPEQRGYKPSHLKKARVKSTRAEYVPSQSRESHRLDRRRRSHPRERKQEQPRSLSPKEILRPEPPKRDPLEVQIENPFMTKKTQQQNQSLLQQVRPAQSDFISQNPPIQLSTQQNNQALLHQSRVKKATPPPQKQDPPAEKSKFTSETFEQKIDKDIVTQKFKQILLRIDMPLNRLFKMMSGDGQTMSRSSMHAYLRQINAGMSLGEVTAFLGEYDRDDSDSLSLLEFQKIVVNLVGVEYIERLNCKHLSTINTDYTDEQKSVMKTILQAFENKKLPLSRQFQLFVKHSPNDRVNAESMHTCLTDDYGLNISKEHLQSLVQKFDMNPNGLSRASFTKLLSTSRVV